jgi:hypothetical protein
VNVVADTEIVVLLREEDQRHRGAGASYGHRRIHLRLRREGWKVNNKRVCRFYKLDGLVMRPKKPR